MSSVGRFTHAVVARVPQSFQSLPSIDGTCIDLERAKEQQEALVKCLRGLDIDVLEMPPDEPSPPSVYTRDCAVTHNGIALICRPGDGDNQENPRRKTKDKDRRDREKGGGQNIARVQDCLSVRAVLKKELGLTVVDLESPEARLSGSDVLFTGREFFVGIGPSTNTEGALAVAATWPEYPCIPVKLEGHKPLGERVSLGGPGILSVGNGQHSQNLVKRMEREATISYQTLTLPEDEAANCIYVNNHLIHSHSTETPLSVQLLKEKIEFATKEISVSEFQKTGRGLSSLCILVKKSKTIRKI